VSVEVVGDEDEVEDEVVKARLAEQLRAHPGKWIFNICMSTGLTLLRAWSALMMSSALHASAAKNYSSAPLRTARRLMAMVKFAITR